MCTFIRYLPQGLWRQSTCRWLGITVLAGLLIFGTYRNLAAEEVWHPEYGWGANIPETWVLMNADEKLNNINFSDSRGHAIFQVFTVEGSAVAYGKNLMAKMAAEPGEAGSSQFEYDGFSAELSDMRWKAGKVPVRGYLMAIDGDQRGFLAVCYSFEEEWPTYHDFLLSNLDAFFIGEDGMFLPGPISQLVAGDKWHGGKILDRKAATDASQNVADREARVLAAYVKASAESQRKAWRRFYQIIYKDSYHRLDAEAEQFAATYRQKKIALEKIPAELLLWIQSFKFEEYKTLSDIRVPIDAIDQKAGDCDGRGLVYSILLDHLGIESLFMVSSVYHHSMVGVNVPGPGYYLPQDGKKWLVAETTAPVPLGNIHSQMTDPKNWTGFDLHFTP